MKLYVCLYVPKYLEKYHLESIKTNTTVIVEHYKLGTVWNIFIGGELLIKNMYLF